MAAGIINNEMYAGRIVWNRVREDRDPDTHGRIVRVNPQESWIVHEAEHLRIVEQSLWDRVKAQQDRRVAAGYDLDVDLHGALAAILLLAIEDESRFVGKNVTDAA